MAVLGNGLQVVIGILLLDTPGNLVTNLVMQIQQLWVEKENGKSEAALAHVKAHPKSVVNKDGSTTFPGKWFLVRICLTATGFCLMKVCQMICLFFSCKIQNTCYNGSGCNKLFRVQCHIISFDPRDNVVISLSWPYKNLINSVKHTNDFPPKADLSFSSIIPQW